MVKARSRGHATLDVGRALVPAFVAARSPRCNPRSGGHAVEHGRRATRRRVIRDHVPADAPGRIEGRCEHTTVQSRAEADTSPGVCCVRGAKPRPRGRALTRHGQWRLHRRADGRRDTRHGVRHVACANHQFRASRLSPRSCRALRATLAPIRGASTRRVSHARSDREAVAAWANGSVTRRSMPCTQSV
jgi:hypothetical protein